MLKGVGWTRNTIPKDLKDSPNINHGVHEVEKILSSAQEEKQYDNWKSKMMK